MAPASPFIALTDVFPVPEERWGIIYIITHRTSGMQYVGQTINTADRRWAEHYRTACRKKRSYLASAIMKYGIEAFDVEVLDWAFTKGELDAKEIYWIATLATRSPGGFNLHCGGTREIGWVSSQPGKKMTPEQIEKLRTAKKGKIVLAKRRPVWCVETGQYFNGLQEAARWVESASGLRFPSGECGIRVARDKPDRTSGGYHWTTSPDVGGDTKLSGRRHKSPIVCVDTGVKYPSINEAERQMRAAIGKGGDIGGAVLRGCRAFGYRWRYAISDTRESQ